MSTDKVRACVLVSSCPDTTDKKWKPNTGDVRDVSREAFLVRIVPEKGRTSPVFRLYSPNMVRMWLEEDKLGNPYGIFGDVVQAFLGVSKYDVSMCVLVNASGNMWEMWNGKRTDTDILKRSKFKDSNKPRAFNVFDQGEEIDTVYYGVNVSIDADEVRESLVNHDGYSPSIEVYEEGQGCPKCEGVGVDDGSGSLGPCPFCGFGD